MGSTLALAAVAALLSSPVMSQSSSSLPNAPPWDQPFLHPAPVWDGASRSLLRDASDPRVTPFEADPEHDFSPNYADTRAWFDRLDAASDLICIEQFGVSPEGRPQAGDAGRVELSAAVHVTKWVIVVDDDIDARDWKDVMWAVSTKMDPARDITLIEYTPIDYLDFASPESGPGSKIGLDATDKLPPETKREWGEEIRREADVVNRVSEIWNRLGLPGDGTPIWK